MRRLPMLLLAAALLLPLAHATWFLGIGTVLQQSATTTLIVGSDLAPTLLTWNSSANNAPPIIDGILLDLQPHDGTTPITWNLDAIGTLNITFHGSPSVQTDIYMTGLLTQGYKITGILVSPEIDFNGPTFKFTAPPGDQTISIIPATPPLSGPRIALEASYSPDNGTINAVVALINPDGSALTGMASAIIMRVVDPNGTLNGTFNLSETITPGVYSGSYNITNTTSAGQLGNWLVTAQYLSITAGWQVRVDHPISLGPGSDSTLSISTSLDTWGQPLLWGILLLLFVWREAWFPAFISLLDLLDSLIAHPVTNIQGRAMLLVLALVLHALVVKGILIPERFRSKE